MVTAADAYRALAPGVLGYLRAERAPDPDDLLSEVFLHVARDISRFKGDDDHLRRWVFTIAYHRLVDARRRAARRPRLARSAVPDVADRGTAKAAADPVDARLIAALNHLSDDQREVVVLRFVADLSLEVVARVTGRTTGAVKALQHRGLERLRILLAPVDAHEE